MLQPQWVKAQIHLCYISMCNNKAKQVKTGWVDAVISYSAPRWSCHKWAASPHKLPWGTRACMQLFQIMTGRNDVGISSERLLLPTFHFCSRIGSSDALTAETGCHYHALIYPERHHYTPVTEDGFEYPPALFRNRSRDTAPGYISTCQEPAWWKPVLFSFIKGASHQKKKKNSLYCHRGIQSDCRHLQYDPPTSPSLETLYL